MKHIILSILLLVSTTILQAQDEVSAKQLNGMWKLVIKIDEEDKQDVEDEIEDEHPLIQSFVKAVTGFAFDVVEEIDVRFEFEKDGTLISYTSFWGDEDYEKSEWTINKYGGLVFDTNVKVTDWDEQAWYFVDDILVPCDQKGRRIENRNVHLVQID
ncbi:MAG: hypothetical protein AAF363_20995 [Bacteroidota bacterium]